MHNNLNDGIKAFFIDLDGTLLDTTINGREDISQINLDAIKNARENGIHIILSTGRSGVDASSFIKKTGVTNAVLANGAIIWHNNKILKKYLLTLRQVLLLREFAIKNKLAFKINDQVNGYGAVTPILRFVTKKFHFKCLTHYNFDLEQEVAKMVFWGKTKWKLLKLIEILKKEVPNVSIVTSSNGWTVEVTNEKATKGLGDEEIAKLLGFQKRETAHIGDTMNDSTVVGHVDRLIVMANGDKKLRKISPYLGPHHKNGGVAKILSGGYKKTPSKSIE